MRLLLNTSFRFTDAQRAELQAVSPGLDIAEECVADPDDLSGAGVTVLVTEQIPRNIDAWQDLQWVQLLSAGANQLCDHPIQRSDIPVTTASGVYSAPIAQYITCTWLMMMHRMPALLEFKASRAWPDRLALAGIVVRGMTAGLIGYGGIGRESARQLHALGMRIVCLKRDPAGRRHRGYNAGPDTGDPDGSIPEAWYGPDDLADMLPTCDLLVVTAPSTPRTQGMIGQKELALLKKGARIIIVSRGGIVEEKALADALRSGRIAEAVVDCFAREPPPPDHAFFDTPNLIMTPHMSGVYDGYWPAMVGLLIENLRTFAAGRPPLNQANRSAEY